MNFKDEARDLGAAEDEKDPTASSSGDNVEPDATDSEPREPATRKLIEKTRLKAAGALMGSLITLLAGLHEAGGAVESIVEQVFGGDPQEEIEGTMQGHYKALGEGDFEKAFGFFGLRGGDEVRDKEEWIEEQTKEQNFCPIEKSEVKDVQVADVEDESTAVATADVHFDYKCGQSDWRFIWNVSKAGGEWKLDSQEEAHATSTQVPITFANEGRTESAVDGKTKQANLKSVKTSATANAAPDSSGNWVTYEPEKVVDGQPDTAWQVALEDDDVTYQEAVDGQPDTAWQVAFKDGEEPWVSLEYDKPITISRVGIIPGYSKKDPADGTDRFYQMYAVRKARIEFSSGESTEVDFEQDPEMKFVEVPNTETTFVRVEILDTYPPRQKSPGGVSYDNGLFGKVAISEIEVEES